MECKVNELVKRGHDQAAELKSSCGAVDVRDVAQFISDLATQLDVQLARSNTLASENAGLKESRKNLAEFIHEELDAGYPLNMDIETPATDAFLAEVRAQGVDSAINTVIAMMNHQHPVTSKAIDIMRVHAYQIRKGVQS
ncbi:hypothetical protein [Escherichia coli]|uniref:hypothetical protein n=1 Tax=Escherichia coli TaxID=562 RepID=UPI000BE5345B|nr:hypothetical protein [Escherichia coli]EIQ2250072.1 hypothetical protein [Escherichia coli]